VLNITVSSSTRPFLPYIGVAGRRAHGGTVPVHGALRWRGGLHVSYLWKLYMAHEPSVCQRSQELRNFQF
jgi:hypothetical protein